MPHKKCRVVSAYRSAYPDPLILKHSDSVTIKKEDPEFEGWLWCTDESGKCGWIPREWLTINGDSATLVRDYSATELTVSEGEILIIVLEESGWVLCEHPTAGMGWLPSKTITIIDDSDS